MAAPARPAAAQDVPTLRVPRLEQAVRIDGRLEEPCYKDHAPLEAFRVAASPRQKAPRTRAWVFWSTEKVVFAFECEDPLIVAWPPSGNKQDVNPQDRGELFLWDGIREHPYLCLEMAARGAVNDYRARFYRKFDSTWNTPGLTSATTITKTGYTVEAEFAAEALTPYGIELKPGARFRGGLFRAEYTTAAKGAEPWWITWVEAGVKSPDFHIERSFGRFVLEP
jgi:hypothetical protein